MTFTFWNYYVLKLLCLETITFSDAMLSDINIVLCYILSQYQTMILGCGKVMCGEWEVGSVPASWSGELYNIVLDVQKIIPHPLYNVSAVKSFH